MAVNTAVVDAPPETVFSVLADPPSYASFVVGTKRIRRFDPRFPEQDSEFHHTLGVGPVPIVWDLSRVEEVVEGRRLVLRAQMRPMAVNRVAFTLRPVDAGTEVEVEEYAIEGPAALLWNPAFDALMWLRNSEMLRRLKELAERRHALAASP
jgi:uncharacterized protein YndB with AHSA1/START domain